MESIGIGRTFDPLTLPEQAGGFKQNLRSWLLASSDINLLTDGGSKLWSIKSKFALLFLPIDRARFGGECGRLSALKAIVELLQSRSISEVSNW